MSNYGQVCGLVYFLFEHALNLLQACRTKPSFLVDYSIQLAHYWLCKTSVKSPPLTGLRKTSNGVACSPKRNDKHYVKNESGLRVACLLHAQCCVQLPDQSTSAKNVHVSLVCPVIKKSLTQIPRNIFVTFLLHSSIEWFFCSSRWGAKQISTKGI